MARQPTAPKTKQVETLTHTEAKRRNIPTAELQSAAQRIEESQPFKPVVYPRRTPLSMGETRPRDADLDPQIVWKGARIRLTADQIKEAAEKGYVDIDDAQLVWRGKDQQDWSDLVVHAPPLYIQEKVHPKAIIDDLKRRTKAQRDADSGTFDLFHDFNGIDPEAKTEFYAHDQNWSNRFILGDSLQVMASLAEREGLRGQVQSIYFDPPYGIKFGSNWQVSTQNRDVKDGKLEEMTREPEQIRAFRDTWKNGIHSYLTYLRDRVTAMRDLLTPSGSIFVQIGDSNMHHVREILDEVLGAENFVSLITFRKTNKALGAKLLGGVTDYIVWYARNKRQIKFRRLMSAKTPEDNPSSFKWVEIDDQRVPTSKVSKDKEAGEYFTPVPMTSSGYTPSCTFDFSFEGRIFTAGSKKSWATTSIGVERLKKANRIFAMGKTPFWIQYYRELSTVDLDNVWDDTRGELQMSYVVQTSAKVVERCLLMTSDPGDLVLDPTCGSGTTATVAEQWGRRWITIDTSRVALALARARVMGAKYPYYMLADSKEGRQREAELVGKVPMEGPAYSDVRQGFVYDRNPKVTLKSISNNAQIDVIWDEFQAKMEPIRRDINNALGKAWEEWEIPREAGSGWSDNIKGLHRSWWELRIARQKKIDESIAKKADVELLYDRPHEDKSRVRVAGPFTVESLSPHRVVPSSEDELIDELDAIDGKRKRKLPKGTEESNDFASMILEHLKTSGVQQAKKANRIEFEAITPWPGIWISADGRFLEGETLKRAAIFIGPEFGTVSRADLTAAAREALDAGYDALIACGFNFEAHTSELNKLGPLPILKAKMNPELHMSDELKNTGSGNLFVVFGEPDIKWNFNAEGEVVVEVLGIDVFDPKTSEVRSSGKEDIAAWFIDTDYDEESFFVRHAYFLGANDPYSSLRKALKADIDEAAWETLYRDTSRPFIRPSTGRFAVKVINHFGDEVMKVFAV